MLSNSRPVVLAPLLAPLGGTEAVEADVAAVGVWAELRRKRGICRSSTYSASSSSYCNRGQGEGGMRDRLAKEDAVSLAARHTVRPAASIKWRQTVTANEKAGQALCPQQELQPTTVATYPHLDPHIAQLPHSHLPQHGPGDPWLVVCWTHTSAHLHTPPPHIFPYLGQHGWVADSHVALCMAHTFKHLTTTLEG